MRVHLKNVVQSALEKGVVVGYHRVEKLSKHKRSDMDAVVDTMMKSLWESLDGIIDFTDEDDPPVKGQERAAGGIGFHSADAVSTTSVGDDVEEDPYDDDEDIVPLDVLYRLHRHVK